MVKALKRWLAKVAYEGRQEQHLQESRVISKLGSELLLDSGASFVVYQIDNGFVVRTMVGICASDFTYCADHQAIADHLVSSAAKKKLGVQSDMFEKEKQAAQRQYAASKSSDPNVAQSSI